MQLTTGEDRRAHWDTLSHWHCVCGERSRLLETREFLDSSMAREGGFIITAYTHESNTWRFCQKRWIKQKNKCINQSFKNVKFLLTAMLDCFILHREHVGNSRVNFTCRPAQNFFKLSNFLSFLDSTTVLNRRSLRSWYICFRHL